MNKLIKFLSLATVLVSSLSLYAMEQEYPIKTDSGRIIPANKFLVTGYAGDCSIYVGYVGVIDGNIIGYERDKALALAHEQKFTVEFLRRNNLINVCFADTETCNKNSIIVENLVSRYTPVFNDYPNVYLEMAKGVIQSVTNEKEAVDMGRIPVLLTAMINSFHQHHSFPSAFFYTIQIKTKDAATFVFNMKDTTNFTEDLNINVQKAQAPCLFDAINLLVQTAIRKQLGIYCTSDDFSSFEGLASVFGLKAVPEEEFSATVLQRLNNNDIISFTICETGKLLEAINSVLDIQKTPQGQ